ncbi:anthrone oxygenase family protein [Nocardia sp. NPDC101769]|uniref:anthrone oxygenase family protein n=1 Tax=Nocardia sp. NPDC101769 TaxID=3364333 RepID=UPI00382C9944
MSRSTVTTVLVRNTALVSTGILAGAFTYARVAVSPTFRAVPMDVHLTFRVALMAMNAPFMQALMGLGAVTSLVFAYTGRGRARIVAAIAGGAALTSLLVTRFGNVPINERIKTWHIGSLPANYEDQLNRWETFHDIRTAAAVLAFILLLTAVEMAKSGRTATPAFS